MVGEVGVSVHHCSARRLAHPSGRSGDGDGEWRRIERQYMAKAWSLYTGANNGFWSADEPVGLALLSGCGNGAAELGSALEIVESRCDEFPVLGFVGGPEC